MGKLFDYCMTGNWEETQRINLYKKVGNMIENTEDIEELKQKIESMTKK